MKPKFARAVLIAAAVAAVTILATLDNRPMSDANAAPPQVEAQKAAADQDLPDFKPSEQLPADSAVAFPTDI